MLLLYLLHDSSDSGDRHLMEKLRIFKLPETKAGRCHRLNASHLPDVERVVIEAFDKEGDGSGWQLLVVSEQQRQEADGDVLKLPRP